MDAALEGARLRLRPILMTSFAFILGCVPLAIASGAGAVVAPGDGHRRSSAACSRPAVIAIFLIPMTFYVVEQLAHRKAAPAEPAAGGPAPAHAAAQKGGEHA